MSALPDSIDPAVTSRSSTPPSEPTDVLALRIALNALSEGVILLDRHGNIRCENPVGRQWLEDERALRCTPDGRPLPGGPLPAELMELVLETIGSGRPGSRNHKRGGRQYLVNARPAGQRLALLQIRDVTDERDNEVRRVQSEKLLSIGMMAAGVAHEINNPASFVLANIDAIALALRTADEKLDQEPEVARRLGLRDVLFDAMAVVQESKEGMARIHRIVRDLHSFSRVDDDPTAVTSVDAAIESALTMLRNELRYRVTLERHLTATRSVRAGTARLGQVFLNLVINAVHAMADRDPARNRLVVRSYDRGSDVVVEVEDNGPGIAPEIMPRIFDTFFTTKEAGLGTGLGLPISRDIIRSLGGDLRAESQLGSGALFRVTLPAVAAPPLAEPEKAPAAVVKRRRVLAVDDEALLLKAYRRMLVGHHDVETRVGAREAIELLETDQHFDVVLCDLQMPEISGVELHAIAQRRWPHLARRFIFITGGAFSPEARKFIDELPEAACINKPFYVNELLEVIERRLAEDDDDGPLHS